MDGAINSYDRAVLNKVKQWFSNTYYADTALVYNTIFNLLDNTVDKGRYKVPMINLYRPQGFNLTSTQNFAATKQGLLYQHEADRTGTGARFITVNLLYQFDIYAKTPEDLNIMAESLIKSLNFFPTVDVIHKDNVTKREFIETYEIDYVGGPVPQSEFTNDDRVYRYYLQYEIKNAKIYDFTDLQQIVDTEVNVDAEIETEH